MDIANIIFLSVMRTWTLRKSLFQGSQDGEVRQADTHRNGIVELQERLHAMDGSSALHSCSEPDSFRLSIKIDILFKSLRQELAEKTLHALAFRHVKKLEAIVGNLSQSLQIFPTCTLAGMKKSEYCSFIAGEELHTRSCPGVAPCKFPRQT